MTDTYLALDGPLNGTYIDAEQAFAHEYELTDWSSGEVAYLHVPSNEAREDGIPLEILEEIEALGGPDADFEKLAELADKWMRKP